jgi:hypothetical protein
MRIDSIKYMIFAYNLLVNNANKGVFNITTSAKYPNSLDWVNWEIGSNFNGVYSKDGTIGELNDIPYKSFADWQDNCPYNPDPHSYFGEIDFDNDTTGLKLICGSSASMQIEKGRLLPMIQYFLSQLNSKGFFINEDINGKGRDTSQFWIGGHSDADIKTEISGYITDLTDTIKAGKVKVFAEKAKETANETMILQEIGELNISDKGLYQADTLPIRDKYWLKIIPDKDEYPDYIPSYRTRDRRWDASVSIPTYFEEFCFNNEVNDTDIYNIFPKKIDEFPTGDYSISGNISQTVKTDGSRKMLAMDPIPGLDVILDVTPPRPPRTVAITQTDEHGNYTFSNLPISDSLTYTVIIDHYGLPADTLYEIKLEDDITNLNYCVDTTVQIEGCAEPMLGQENLQLKGILLYPNPLGETLTISGAGEKFDLSIVDTQGKRIMNLVNQNEKALISTTDLQSGLYFVIIRTPDGESSYKVIK